jgi:hypothetical protein
MGLGIAKVHEESIPEQLGDMSIVALDDFSTSRLIGTHHVTPVFWVELAGEFGRIDQVTEHHRELPSLRVGRRRGSNARCDLRGGLLLGSRLWCCLSRWSGDFLGSGSFTSPHEHLTILISGKLVDFDEFILQDI